MNTCIVSTENGWLCIATCDGGSEPAPEVAAAIHERVYEHVNLVPKMGWAITFHEMGSADAGADVETHERLLRQL
eukprot:6202221-Pyramimonas_sp.AAC.1